MMFRGASLTGALQQLDRQSKTRIRLTVQQQQIQTQIQSYLAS